MEYGQVAGVSKPVSRIVQGCDMISSAELDASFALLDAALAQGINTFDSGHGYGNPPGDVDRTLGRWIQDRGVRDQVVILAKGAHHNQDRKRVTPYDIASDLHDTLARMKTDHLDMYLLHRDDPTQPVGPIVDALNLYHQQGKIGAFGGSNWSHERVAAANAYAAENGLTGFSASSPHVSLAVPMREFWPDCLSISGDPGAESRAWYAEHHIPVFSWSSVARGFFTGAYRRDNLHSFSSYNDVLVVETYCSEENFDRFDRANALAKEKGVTVTQMALAYVLNLPLQIHALVGSRSSAEMRANDEALSLKLTPAEMRWLEHG